MAKIAKLTSVHSRDHEIARKVGTSAPTVGKVRADIGGQNVAADYQLHPGIDRKTRSERFRD
jgi:hypothetical protein